MLGAVLALAGLAVGNGGPSPRAARAPAATNFGRVCKAVVRFEGREAYEAELGGRGLMFRVGTTVVPLRCAVALDGLGRVRVTRHGETSDGTIRTEYPFTGRG